MFSRQLHLDQHRLLGAHDYGNRSIGMENVKHLFAEKIKQSSHFLTNPGCFNPITTNENDVTPTPRRTKWYQKSNRADNVCKA